MKKLFFVQWNDCDERLHQQYETDDLLKLFKKLESEFKMPIESINYLKSGVIQLNFDYLSVFMSTEMEKLIDCEVLT